eukprot:gnl/TRDRNA2_/TRDRNA2_90158_c0_seq1.p1 gnl/TRDRNA2_/TRDRNA2_90158_c0~~gnl/TRDRNA2_/TRDRNA2_90158_c0_seq1.p1  ORF type:complete len:400 (+),score=90.21 gnl/TRDRNA2_/TRDRNA2_90158_c0_seq1:117-1202(+)
MRSSQTRASDWKNPAAPGTAAAAAGGAVDAADAPEARAQAELFAQPIELSSPAVSSLEAPAVAAVASREAVYAAIIAIAVVVGTFYTAYLLMHRALPELDDEEEEERKLADASEPDPTSEAATPTLEVAALDADEAGRKVHKHVRQMMPDRKPACKLPSQEAAASSTASADHTQLSAATGDTEASAVEKSVPRAVDAVTEASAVEKSVPRAVDAVTEASAVEKSVPRVVDAVTKVEKENAPPQKPQKRLFPRLETVSSDSSPEKQVKQMPVVAFTGATSYPVASVSPSAKAFVTPRKRQVVYSREPEPEVLLSEAEHQHEASPTAPTEETVEKPQSKVQFARPVILLSSTAVLLAAAVLRG